MIRSRVLVAALLASALAVAGCSDDDAAASAEAVGVSVEPSRYSTIAAAVNVASEDAILVEITARAGDHTVEVPRTADAATEHQIPVVGMRAEQDYDLEVEIFDDEGDSLGTKSASFSTGSVPEEFLDYEFESDPERSSPGYTIVEVSPSDATAYLMAVDDEGEIVWYYQNTGVIGGVEPTPAGTLSSHYWPVGIREMDVLGNVVGNWQFSSSQAPVNDQDAVIDEDLLEQFVTMIEGNEGDPEALPVQAESFDLTSFHHEVWPMPGGTFLGLGTAVHELTPEQRATFCPDDEEAFDVISDVVVEFDRSGEVIREWDLWNAVDIQEVPGHELCAGDGPFASGQQRDWMHANAVVYDEARDAIIISARHTNQIIALRHLDEEGPQSEVLWIFGEEGTIPLEGDLPQYQHAPEVQADGSILLYDNGNRREGTEVRDPENPTYSRAVLYDVDDSSDDPDDWTVTQQWEHRTEDVDGSPLYARFLGDADRLENGDVLVTHGGIDMEGDEDYQHAVIIEVVPEGSDGGDIVWKMVIGDAEAPATVYRSERLSSFYFGPQWASGS